MNLLESISYMSYHKAYHNAFMKSLNQKREITEIIEEVMPEVESLDLDPEEIPVGTIIYTSFYEFIAFDYLMRKAEKFVGESIKIVSGIYKGFIGIIREIYDDFIKVYIVKLDKEVSLELSEIPPRFLRKIFTTYA